MMHEDETRPQMLPALSRRNFLVGASAAAALLAIGNAGASPALATSAGTVLPLVAPLPAGQPVRSQFAPNEQVLAAYLMIVAPLANSVRDVAPNYGWMEDGWWRTPNQPYNTRIMEHVATLSWFYANDRPWNPYYRDPALLGRLDAALSHYLSLQHADGSYPEYSPTEHHLSPTGFGTVALAAVLRDLRAAGELHDRRLQIRDAIRKSSAWLVDTSRPHWNRPVQFANQVVAGLSGVVEAAHILGEPAVSASVPNRLQIILKDGQAPAGFFHEPVAPDAGYNFDVMLPDLGALYKRLPDPSIIQLAERFAAWWGYVVVMEPGRNEGFILSGTSARNIVATFVTTPVDDLDRSALARTLLPHVPALRAFLRERGGEDAGAKRVGLVLGTRGPETEAGFVATAAHACPAGADRGARGAARRPGRCTAVSGGEHVHRAAQGHPRSAVCVRPPPRLLHRRPLRRAAELAPADGDERVLAPRRGDARPHREQHGSG